MSANQYGIHNPNSSGQGHHPEHANNPFHEHIKKHGFEYSHSTPVHQHSSNGGGHSIHHTFKHPSGRAVSTWKNPETHPRPGQHNWSSSKSPGSGRHTSGSSPEALAKHLKGITKKMSSLKALELLEKVALTVQKHNKG